MSIDGQYETFVVSRKEQEGGGSEGPGWNESQNEPDGDGMPEIELDGLEARTVLRCLRPPSPITDPRHGSRISGPQAC